MLRSAVILDAVNGLNRMENGEPYPFPIKGETLSLYQKYHHIMTLPKYRVFVCAMILGKFDKAISKW